MGYLCKNENININSKIFRKTGQDQELRVNKELGRRRTWRLTTTWRGHTANKGKGNKQTTYPGVHSDHAQEEKGRMTPRLPPFVRPGSLHAPTFCWIYAIQAFFIASDFDPKLMPKEKKIRSRWEKFALSYNPFFRVVQITIRAIDRIPRKTSRYSLWNWGKTLFTT